VWVCDPGYQNANDGCDCGCGAYDSDCGGSGCIPPGCYETDASGCDYCWNASIEMVACTDAPEGSACPEGEGGASYTILCTTPADCTYQGGTVEDYTCDGSEVCCFVCSS
jgi:hypothetical protein